MGAAHTLLPVASLSVAQWRLLSLKITQAVRTDQASDQDQLALAGVFFLTLQFLFARFEYDLFDATSGGGFDRTNIVSFRMHTELYEQK